MTLAKGHRKWTEQSKQKITPYRTRKVDRIEIASAVLINEEFWILPYLPLLCDADKYGSGKKQRHSYSLSCTIKPNRIPQSTPSSHLLSISRDMISLRRATARILTSRPSASVSIKSRSFRSFASPSTVFTIQRAAYSPFQRRFASETAASQENAEEPPETEAEAEATSASTDTIVEAPVEEVETASETATEAARATVYDTATSLGQAIAEKTGSDLNQPPGENANVYVGNLFFDVQEEALRTEFEKAGPVKSVKLITDRRGLSKGFGYVEFEDVESAKRAIERFHEQTFEGRRLTVQTSINRTRTSNYARPPSPPTNTLFIGNLSFALTDRELNNLFREIKDVTDVRVAIDRRTGQPRGFAHADFSTISGAQKAYEILNGKVVGGRNLRVDFSHSKGRIAKAEVQAENPALTPEPNT